MHKDISNRLPGALTAFCQWMKTVAIIVAGAVFITTSTGCGQDPKIGGGVPYVNPPWAPPYTAAVRYYYFPDLEMYYDLSDQEFVYLDNGQWLYSPVLPAIYSGYDLYNAFVIALNVNVYRPWMHHQFYVSHYPRYYYHNVYHNRNFATLHGFNENNRRPIFSGQHDRTRPDINPKLESGGNRPYNVNRQPQPINYYGRNIGRPVRVQPQMREGGGRRKP